VFGGFFGTFYKRLRLSHLPATAVIETIKRSMKEKDCYESYVSNYRQTNYCSCADYGRLRRERGVDLRPVRLESDRTACRSQGRKRSRRGVAASSDNRPFRCDR